MHRQVVRTPTQWAGTVVGGIGTKEVVVATLDRVVSVGRVTVAASRVVVTAGRVVVVERTVVGGKVENGRGVRVGSTVGRLAAHANTHTDLAQTAALHPRHLPYSAFAGQKNP